MDDTAFGKAGAFLFPEGNWLLDDFWTLGDVQRLMPYHTGVDLLSTLTVLDYLRNESESRAIFYDIYSEREIASSPDKSDTGLFFFKGNPSKPFALILPGGAMSYIASIHEGFPLALKLSEHGYNAFVLQYRLIGMREAAHDLDQALSFIFENSESLAVDISGFSLWACGVGAEIASLGKNTPACTIVEYSDFQAIKDLDCPVYGCIGKSDRMASMDAMKAEIDAISRKGKSTGFHAFEGVGHGFGLGIGTNAAPWSDEAIHFWEETI